MNADASAKLEKLRAAAASNKQRTGGKGTPRRVVKKTVKTTGAADDKKLQANFKKLNLQQIGGIEEVNMFKEDGSVLHFTAPKVQANGGASTLSIIGAPQQKEMTELVPGILNQLGPEALNNLKKMAAQYQANGGGKIPAATSAVEQGFPPYPNCIHPDDDDEVPELVENFEETSKQ